VHHLKPLGRQGEIDLAQARDIAPWMRETGNEANLDRIRAYVKDDRNCLCRCFGHESRGGGPPETALVQINTAFETMRDGGNALSAAYYGRQLPRARAIFARLRGQ